MLVQTHGVRLRVGLLFMSVALMLTVIRLSAQISAPGPTPSFEVASVKINRSGLPGGFSEVHSGGRFTETNQTLRQIVLDAYETESVRVLGGPSWMANDRFDIDGRAGRDLPREQLLMMMRALLANRFKLVVRTETRERPVFTLTRNDDRTGPRLRPASPSECVDRGGRVSAPAGEPPSCGAMRAGPGLISGRSVPIDRFVQFLSPRVNRVVIDRSGLRGLFDVDLEWTPDEARRAALAQLGPLAPADPNLPEISTALREQLGLRLQPTTAPVDVLLIVSAQQPTEN